MSRKSLWGGRVAAVMVVMSVFAASAAATPAETGATLVQPLPTGQAAPAIAYPAPVLYIKNIDHLAEVVKADEVIHARTKALVAGRNRGLAVLLASVVAGTALVVASLTVFENQECSPDLLGGAPRCTTMPNIGLLTGGAVVAGIGTLIGVAMGPHRNDMIDVVNDWNARHADRPIMLDAPRPRRY
jgi:hypothetical protein